MTSSAYHIGTGVHVLLQGLLRDKCDIALSRSYLSLYMVKYSPCRMIFQMKVLDINNFCLFCHEPVWIFTDKIVKFDLSFVQIVIMYFINFIKTRQIFLEMEYYVLIL